MSAAVSRRGFAGRSHSGVHRSDFVYPVKRKDYPKERMPFQNLLQESFLACGRSLVLDEASGAEHVGAGEC